MNAVMFWFQINLGENWEAAFYEVVVSHSKIISVIWRLVIDRRLVKLVKSIVPRPAIVVDVSLSVTRRLSIWPERLGTVLVVVAADSNGVSRWRLELLERRCDADGSTARVGRSRRPADYWDADDQLCWNTVTARSFHCWVTNSRHIGIGVTPCTDADII